MLRIGRSAFCSARSRPIIDDIASSAPARSMLDTARSISQLTMISSIGSYISGFGILIFFYGMVRAFMKKERAAANPWGPGATTLEWTLPSPPPFHQFNVLPRIR